MLFAGNRLIDNPVSIGDSSIPSRWHLRRRKPGSPTWKRRRKLIEIARSLISSGVFGIVKTQKSPTVCYGTTLIETSTPLGWKKMYLIYAYLSDPDRRNCLCGNVSKCHVRAEVKTIEVENNRVRTNIECEKTWKTRERTSKGKKPTGI